MHKVNNYPLIFQQFVCEYYSKYKKKYSINKILDELHISNGSLYNWIYKYNNNELQPKKRYNKISKFTPEIRCFIRSYVISRINFDCNKLKKLLQKKFKINSSRSSIYEIIKSLNITRKKVRTRIVPNKKLFKAKTKNFIRKIKQLNKDQIVCIDETSIDTHTQNNYGWSKKVTVYIKYIKKVA